MRLALVTGGTKRLGAAIAARLARGGYDCALHARIAEPLDRDLASAFEASGQRWEVIAADLGEPEAAEGLVSETTRRFGRAPDLLVNNASMLSEGGWREMTRASLTHHLDVNLVAPLMLVQALAAALPGGARGAVVNILDQRIGNPPVDQAAYTASKLALSAMTRVLARAFAPQLRVNAVAPGLTIPGQAYTEAQTARLAAAMPLGDLPAPEAIAAAVAMLAGAEAVTGQVLAVDCGAGLESWPRDFVHMFADADG